MGCSASHSEAEEEHTRHENQDLQFTKQALYEKEQERKKKFDKKMKELEKRISKETQQSATDKLKGGNIKGWFDDVSQDGKIHKKDFVVLFQAMIQMSDEVKAPIAELAANHLRALPLSGSVRDKIANDAAGNMRDHIALGLKPAIGAIFTALDADRSGTLDEHEIGAIVDVVAKLQLGPEGLFQVQPATFERIIDILVRIVDTNNNGFLDKKEVVALVEMLLNIAANVAHNSIDVAESLVDDPSIVMDPEALSFLDAPATVDELAGFLSVIPCVGGDGKDLCSVEDIVKFVFDSIPVDEEFKALAEKTHEGVVHVIAEIKKWMAEILEHHDKSDKCSIKEWTRITEKTHKQLGKVLHAISVVLINFAKVQIGKAIDEDMYKILRDLEPQKAVDAYLEQIEKNIGQLSLATFQAFSFGHITPTQEIRWAPVQALFNIFLDDKTPMKAKIMNAAKVAIDMGVDKGTPVAVTRKQLGQHMAKGALCMGHALLSASLAFVIRYLAEPAIAEALHHFSGGKDAIPIYPGLLFGFHQFGNNFPEGSEQHTIFMKMLEPTAAKVKAGEEKAFGDIINDMKPEDLLEMADKAVKRIDFDN